jgi:hypothetical protein
VETALVAAQIQSLANSARALEEYRTEGVPLRGDRDMVLDRMEICVPIARLSFGGNR